MTHNASGTNEDAFGTIAEQQWQSGVWMGGRDGSLASRSGKKNGNKKAEYPYAGIFSLC